MMHLILTTVLAIGTSQRRRGKNPSCYREDVKRAANKYLTTENRTVAIYTRKAGSTKPEEKVIP